ncbi:MULTISPECIES: dipeptide ABC transporter ATP-binding protein [unclassified Sutcliffiella]|jgi:peptide/nickel transport system ATP-binding protein/oligopeptide transport system ATP-binding protein|uniref:ABC transporter ATP-binding protein n=1 Tax=unclassified Sutcliffiella TaxID=2837532 RepID=UPI0030D0288E
MMELVTKKEAKRVLLSVKNLKQYFPIKKDSLFKPTSFVKAVDDISFELKEGETLSIVGESGCGKSTTGRSILRLEQPTDGEIVFNDKDLVRISNTEMRKVRADLQVIFQDPFASLNPRRTIKQTLNEAMAIQQVIPKQKRMERMLELLECVGLPAEALNRYPHEFSGGQRQRIGIARALAVNPKLIICDEAVSALDVSIQAQILNLLKDLQKDFGLTYLFISHDLSVVRHISDRVMVMYLGKIVEIAEKKSIFERPQHPYTQALLSAIPTPDLDAKKEKIVLKGDVPSPIDPPTGCRFHTRCPLANETCKKVEPPLKKWNNQHYVSCHLVK